MLRNGLLATLLATLAIAAPASAAALTGTVTAAGQPVAGATVELYAAGATGATRLTAATTDGSGAYALDYALPADAGALYAVAHGGAAPATMRLAAAAPVSELPDTLPITEQSTVAVAYAFAQFLDPAGAIHGPSPGLPNAALTATTLIEPATAKIAFPFSGAPNGNLTEALPKFNTVAALLQRCTAPGRQAARGCAVVRRATTPPGGARPADTLQIARNLAHNPTLRPRQLYGLQVAHAYTPQLTAPPSNWLIAITFTGFGLNAPGRMAFDAAGNAWIGNNFQGFGTTAGLELTALDPTGGRALPGAPYTGGGLRGVGWGTAIDHRGRIWLGNYAGSSASLFNPDGTPVAGSPFTQGGIDKPQGLAVDAQDNVWFANFGNASVTVYPHGDPSQARSITGGGLDRPFGLQIGADGVAWVTNQSISPQAGSVIRINPDGTFAGPPITGGGLRSPMSLAFDSRGNAWVANLFSDAVTQISPAGVATAHRFPAAKGSWSTAIDGDDHVWVADFFPTTVSELCGVRTDTCPPGVKTGQPLSPRRHGYTSKAFQHITAVQIDPSGNVWLANNWSTGSPPKDFVGGNGIVKLIGAAAPVRTPLFGLPEHP
jgi:hypothetical protein